MNATVSIWEKKYMFLVSGSRYCLGEADNRIRPLTTIAFEKFLAFYFVIYIRLSSGRNINLLKIVFYLGTQKKEKEKIKNVLIVFA